MAENSCPPSHAPPPGATPCSISATFTSGCLDSSYAHDRPVHGSLRRVTADGSARLPEAGADGRNPEMCSLQLKEPTSWLQDP